VQFDDSGDVHRAEFSIAKNRLDDEDVRVELVYCFHGLPACSKGFQQGTEQRKYLGRFEIGAQMDKR
jgi:hypothetical protein